MAVARGVSIEQLNALNSPTQSHSTFDSKNNVGGEFKEESGNGAGIRTKRKYRRHPKVGILLLLLSAILSPRVLGYTMAKYLALVRLMKTHRRDHHQHTSYSRTVMSNGNDIV